MILINLLPYREAARKRHKEVFRVTMLTSLLMGALLAALLYAGLRMQIESQQARNAFLRAEIALLNQQIKEIESLEQDISHLSERQKAVEALQTNRNMPVHLLNGLVHQLPEGVYITTLKQNAGAVEMRGVAQSNERVSELLRKFSASRPNLKEIVAANVAVTPLDQRKVVNFTMHFALTPPVNVQTPEERQVLSEAERVH